jgi:shikimate dehydrogenase
LHYQKALVLGSGGASKAVQFALRQNNILFEVVSSSGKGNLIYADLSKDIIQSHLLIINTTPLGMSPNIDTAPELPYQFLTGDHILYDLVYNPAKTRFLEKGELQGARIINGYDMLVLQAEESWRIWNQD